MSGPQRWHSHLHHLIPQNFKEKSSQLPPRIRGQQKIAIQGKEKGFPTPDECALVDALKASKSIKSLSKAQRIHALVVKLGFHQFTVLVTALIDLNLKCSNLVDAKKLFDELSNRDVVSWTSIIVGFAKHERYKDSLDAFKQMIAAGTAPNEYSFCGALSACSGLEALIQGRQIHARVLILGVLDLDQILQNSLLHMYFSSQSINCARKVFDSMASKDIIAWNELISGYLQFGEGEEAMKLFVSMVSHGIKPDDFTLAICINACASLTSMQQGTQIHAIVVKSGFQLDLVVGNALLDMYAKCGSVDSAVLVFELMLVKDTVLWTAMISTFGKHGHVKEALRMFERMKELNMRPDEVTFLAVISACGHAGLIAKGWHYFRSMTEEYSISPIPEHYACMVDLLCRSGCLDQALQFINRMHLKPTVRVWTTLLNSCRLYGNIDLAQFAATQLLEVDPENHSGCVVLSNMHAAANYWSGTEKIRESMKRTSTKKEPGCSWIEVKKGVHVFLTANRSHPEMDEILWNLNRLSECLKFEECY